MTAFSNYKELHSKFKLNGVRYDVNTLQEMAYDLIREGEEYEKHIGNFLIDWLDEKDELLVRTSGSTGVPKSILLKKQHMANSAMATGLFFDLQPHVSALLCLPAAYIAGKMMLVRALVLGLELDCVPPSSEPLKNLSKSYDFCAMVPLQLQNSLHSISLINRLIVGGAPMSADLKNQVQEKSTRIYETYGMTETITHVAVREINIKNSGGGDHGDDKSFRALPDVHFEQDNRDCLVINAPKVSDTPIVTNDMVNLKSETKFEWLGRYDHVINSGGIKLFPEQIEAKLAGLIENSFFVAGVPDPELGQRLVLLVEAEVPSKITLDYLRQNAVLKKFEIPKAIFQVPNFSRTDTGKIRRKATLKLL